MKILYITCKNKEEAISMSKTVVNMRLAACGNSFPITSSFFWEDKVQDEDQYVLLLKTDENKIDSLREEIKRIHSFAVPCILEFDVKANKEYEKWLSDYLNE